MTLEIPFIHLGHEYWKTFFPCIQSEVDKKENRPTENCLKQKKLLLKYPGNSLSKNSALISERGPTLFFITKVTLCQRNFLVNQGVPTS
jgi:hypothetical protein